MARKNRQQLINNRVEYYKQEEAARLEKHAKRNKTRLANAELKR